MEKRTTEIKLQDKTELELMRHYKKMSDKNWIVNNKYIALNRKTQILTPTLLGEMIFDVVNASISSLLRADLTASWEKGLTGVAEGTITNEEYMEKLEGFINRCTARVLQANNQNSLKPHFDIAAQYYKK